MDYRLRDLGIDKSQVENIFSCSPTQLAFLGSQKRDSSVYFTRITFDINGLPKASQVVVEKVSDAWKEVVKHHSILRTILVDGISTAEGFSQVLICNPSPNITIDKSIENKNISKIFNTQATSV